MKYFLLHSRPCRNQNLECKKKLLELKHSERYEQQKSCITLTVSTSTSTDKSKLLFFELPGECWVFLFIYHGIFFLLFVGASEMTYRTWLKVSDIKIAGAWRSLHVSDLFEQDCQLCDPRRESAIFFGRVCSAEAQAVEDETSPEVIATFTLNLFLKKNFRLGASRFW